MDDNKVYQEEIEGMRKIIKSMVLSYDVLMEESPFSKNSVALGVIRGSFIDVINDARSVANGSQITNKMNKGE